MRATPVDVILAKVARRIGRHTEDVQPYVELLQQHWYDDADSLASLGQEDLQAIGVPLRITKELAAMGALAEGGDDLPPSPEAPRYGKASSKDRDKGKGKGGKGKSDFDRGDSSKGKGYGKDRGKGDWGDRGKGFGKDRGKGKGGDSKHEIIDVLVDDYAQDFPWREKICGPGGQNLNHIRSQTKVGLWLNGNGEDEPWHLTLKGNEVTAEAFEKAAEMCNDLLDAIYKEASEWDGGEGEEQRPPKGKGKGKKGKGKSKSKGKGKDAGSDAEEPPAKRRR